jgi:hypothetical protein
VRDSQAFVEFVEEKAAAGGVGLESLTIDDELGDGALAHVTKHFGGCGGIGVDIDLGVADAVRFEELLGGPAVPAP